MDKALFLRLLDNHVKAIIDAEDGKDTNEILLRTVKLMLDGIDCSDDILSGYQKLEMRKLFASFGKMAQTACDFYMASKKYLDQVALDGDIGKKWEKTVEEVTRVNALIESIEKNNADLLEKEKELCEMYDSYNSRKEKIRFLEELEVKLDELQRMHSSYNLHLLENDNIISKLKEYGIPAIDELDAELSHLSASVGDELIRYDSIIKGILIGQKKLNEEILVLQNKVG